MSLFNSSKAFGGLGAAPKQPQDVASEIARLLNQHSHHWVALEKEIKETKSKQAAAQEAYAAVLEGKEAARAALVAAETALAGAEADGTHFRAELESSQAANAKLLEEVEALKQEVAGITRVADEARQAFSEQVAGLMVALRQLRDAHPDSFFRGAVAVAALQ